MGKLLKREKADNVFYLKKFDDVFTNSKMIAKGSGIEHKRIKELINKHEERIEFFGKKVTFEDATLSGQKEVIYNLNEMQATFLITLLRNAELTRKGEADYIQEFVIYAEESGSKNSKRFWKHFSNLTNKLCGRSSRDIATAKQLDKLERLEKLITGMIREKVENKVEYHDAYKEIAKQISDIAKYII